MWTRLLWLRLPFLLLSQDGIGTEVDKITITHQPLEGGVFVRAWLSVEDAKELIGTPVPLCLSIGIGGEVECFQLPAEGVTVALTDNHDNIIHFKELKENENGTLVYQVQKGRATGPSSRVP
ncbi:unnamed protein product, partial [Choristocarpus tenellus]